MIFWPAWTPPPVTPEIVKPSGTVSSMTAPTTGGAQHRSRPSGIGGVARTGTARAGIEGVADVSDGVEVLILEPECGIEAAAALEDLLDDEVFPGRQVEGSRVVLHDAGCSAPDVVDPDLLPVEEDLLRIVARAGGDHPQGLAGGVHRIKRKVGH